MQVALRKSQPASAGQMAGWRVIVWEPDPLDAAVVLATLAEAGHVGVAVSDPGAVLEETSTRASTAVVLADTASGHTSLQLCSELRGNGYRGAIVQLMASPDPWREANLLKGGADAVVAKPIHPRLLLARLEAAARSRVEANAFRSDVLKLGDAELSVRHLRFTVSGRSEVVLTVTEARLLEHLMYNSPRTVTRDSLIERAWPDDELVDPNRVDVYVARLRKKIEPNPAQPAYIYTVRGIGYYFRPPGGSVSAEAWGTGLTGEAPEA